MSPEVTFQKHSETHTPNAQLERVLLLLVGAFVFTGFLSLTVIREGDVIDWMPFFAWVLCAIAGTVILEHYLPQRDPVLFPVTMLLAGWGLVIIDRLAPFFADRQAIWLIVSVSGMIISATLPRLLYWLQNYRYVILLLGLGLLISTIILGRNPSGFGPELWLGFGSVYFQPSEVLKIILVAFLASYLGEQYPTMRAELIQSGKQQAWLSPRILGPLVLMWGLSVVVTVWQRDLGTAVLFFVVFLVLIYVASGSRLIIIGGGILILIAAAVAYSLFDVVQLRIDIWMNPWPEADGRAYQIVQSLMAFAAGGTFGQGIAQGSPGYIPVVHSDFVFAALAEEWGLLGVIVLTAAIAILVMRGLQIAVLQQGKPFYSLLTIGLTMLLTVQSLLIMGGVLKLVPLTGVTLPFLSYGGSSLLVSFIIMGLLIRLSAGRT